MSQVVSLLTIDARGAETGSALYVRSMQAAQAAVDRIRDAEERATAARERSLGIMTTQQDGLSKTARAWEKLRASVDPAISQQKDIERATLAADAAFRRGLATQQEAARVVDMVKARYQTAATANDNFAASAANVNKQTGLARHELINLGRQVQDIGTQLALGQSPMQVFASQAAQVADIFMSTQGSIGGFLRQVGGGALRFALSGTGLAAGAATIGAGAAYAAYSYAEAQKSVQKALLGVGAASGVTVAGINRLADAEAAAAKVSVASAREMLSAYAATGKVDPTRLPGLTGFSRQYAAFQGLGNEDAAKELAGAFADPARGAEMLAGKLGGLSEISRRWIVDQQAASNMLGAQTALLQTFQPQVEGATERLNFFARAWDAVKRSASDASDALGRALNGPTDAERLAALQQQRDRLQASPGLGVHNQLRMLEAQIRPLEAIVELERQRGEIVARRAKADNASLVAGQIVESLDPYRKALTELVAQKSKLDEAVRLNPGVQGLDEWRQWSKIVDDASKTLLTTGERQRQANDLTVRTIGARTLAERTAAEVARIHLDVAGDAVKMKERELLIVGKIAEMQAQANREARDAVRSASDRAELAGLRPYQRRQREIDFQYRDNMERFGGAAASTAALPATTGILRNMDGAFAANLKRAMDDIPGLSITSGWRSMERQAQLQREKPGWAASPTGSNHPKGLAADLAYNGSSALSPELRARLERDYGLSFPLANRTVRPEPWHAEPTGVRGGVAANGNGAAAGIRAADLGTADLETYNSIIRSANDNLAAQQAQLKATRDTLLMSNEEVVRAQKFQELYNQALQEGGVALANKLSPAIATVAAGYGALARQTEELQRAQDAMKTLGDTGRSVLGGLYSDLRTGASGAEMFRNALDKIASKLLDMALNDIFGKAFGNNGMGLFGNGGGGFFGGLMNIFGGGGGSNPLDFSRGAAGLYGPGFAIGGYTGAGGKFDAAGFVHRNEYVFSSESVNRIGLSNLDALHRGSLRGYASGGYVGGGSVSPTPYLPPAANQNPSGRVSVSVNNRTAGRVSSEATVNEKPNGSLEVVLDLVEVRQAKRVARGQGPLSMAMKAVGENRQLRG